MDYIVDLEKFYGPLELLLYLVEKNEMDIYDIPVAEITRQYMTFVENSESIDLESLGDFLVMASFLLNLKSRLLLPVRSANAAAGPEEAEEMLDPRQELVNMLLEYKKYKRVADYLARKQIEPGGRVYFRESSLMPASGEELQVSINSLIKAYINLMNRDQAEDLLYFPVGDIDIGEKMVEILSLLDERPESSPFQVLIDRSRSRREAAVYFLALLELIRMNKVTAVQDAAFGTIQIYLGEGGRSGH